MSQYISNARCSSHPQMWCQQGALDQVSTMLRHVAEVADAPVSEQKLMSEQLVVSTNDVVSLILSLVMYSPSRFPQLPKLNMADGSVNEQKGPQDAVTILVTTLTSLDSAKLPQTMPCTSPKARVTVFDFDVCLHQGLHGTTTCSGHLVAGHVADLISSAIVRKSLSCYAKKESRPRHSARAWWCVTFHLCSCLLSLQQIVCD